MKKILLCILDGWGNSENNEHNAIGLARKPHWDEVSSKYPMVTLNASGVAVGVPVNQMGNSEVGHMTIGSGRIIKQDLQRINEEIDNIDHNHQLVDFVQKNRNFSDTKLCHVVGLFSDGGVHSHYTHILKIIDFLTKNGLKVAIHVILDGRDTPPCSAIKYINILTEYIQDKKHYAFIATVTGRYYAMDRDKRTERTIAAYDAMFFGKGENSRSAKEAIEKSYSNNITDEFVRPTVIGSYAGGQHGDSVVIANFRGDRVLQIIDLITGRSSWEYKKIDFFSVIGMTEYVKGINIGCIFPPVSISNCLGEVLSSYGLKQLRVAETEKYAHVTFFFNCGLDTPYEGEFRRMVQSPKVETYDLKPEMSAVELTEMLIESINSNEFELIVANFANADMVAHTGNINATITAIETLDLCIGKILNAVSRNDSIYTLILTSDHGNAEKMFDTQTSMPHTAHTTNTVPFIVCDKNIVLNQGGGLQDIAPTILDLLNIPKPKEMTGNSLIL